jgi:AcrR family transcriptional regulator
MTVSRRTVPRPRVGTRSRPRRRLDDLRRPQILATAIELIRERGLWDVRLADVAQRAGLSPTTVVYYFGTKDALLAEAIAGADDAFYAPLAGQLEAMAGAVDRIAALVVRSSTSDWLLWMELWVYARHHPEASAAQAAFHQRWRETIEALVRYGCDTGAWGVDDPRGVAQRMAALTDGLAVHMVLGSADHAREQYVSMTLAALALELGCPLEELRRAAADCPPAEDEE